MNDRTSAIENALRPKGKPLIRHLYRMWKFAFFSTKGISCIYLGLFIFLSCLRPALAIIWKNYIAKAEDIGGNETIVSLIILLIAYWLISYLAGLIDSYMAVDGDGDLEQLDAVQANRQQEKMHSKMYKKLGSISPEYFEISKINDEVQQVFNFAGNPSSGINRNVMLNSYIVIAKIVSLVTIALSLYVFNPWLCLILLVAPLPVIWTSTIGEKLRFDFAKENTIISRRIRYFQDIMLSNANKEIKTLGLHDYFYGLWKSLADEFTERQKMQIRKQIGLNTINSCIANLLNIGCIIYTVILMTMGQISLSVFGAVVSLIGTIIVDTTQLLSTISALIGKKQDAKQFFDLMTLPEQVNSGNSLCTFETLKFKSVKYRYPLTDRYVLDGVDLSVRKGERVAFVGENGSGKTTMVKLILGLLKPSDGELLVNDIPVDDLNPIQYCQNQSAVMQQPARYLTFTAKENVSIGDITKEYDENNIKDALNFAHIGDIDKDKVLGKDVGGIELSGGQWQKLAIARAIYRSRNFIVLDEPTSNLDPLVETEIFQKYIELAEDKTVIFVTHRISAAALADRIVVFKNGKIYEDGTHGELMNRKGEYARLFREQAKWYNR